MSTLLAMPQTLTHVGRFETIRPAAPPTQGKALVVASRSAVAEAWHSAGEESAWFVERCGTSAEAVRASQRAAYDVAVVDLSAAGADEPALRRLVEELARTQTLVVVCGQEDDALAEIWARGLGVWLYLSGVDEGCEFAPLLVEARKATEKTRLVREANHLKSQSAPQGVETVAGYSQATAWN